MFEALKDIACFVTVFVSMLYGTRIAWGCGLKCQFNEKQENRFQALFESIPAATIIYFFGFFIIFSYLVSGPLSRVVFAITSAILLSSMVVSTTMPELKRKPRTEGLVLTELTDGTCCLMAKKALNIFLANGRVVKFKRSDGWVVVGRDRLRDMDNGRGYSGVERREAA